MSSAATSILTARTGGIGTATAFLEINLLNATGTAFADGVLNASAVLGSIYLTETAGNLRVDRAVALNTVTLTTRAGSILDANNDLETGIGLDLIGTANVQAVNINVVAAGGSIGAAANDLDIDTRVQAAGQPTGPLYAAATGDIYITEVSGGLRVLAAKSSGGYVRLTVPDTAAAGEDLVVLDRGTAVLTQDGPIDVVPQAEVTSGNTEAAILAAVSIALWAGDNVTTAPLGRIVAGQGIVIRGDSRRRRQAGDDEVDGDNVDAGIGTTMLLQGAITPGAGFTTEIFGHTDDDSLHLRADLPRRPDQHARQPEHRHHPGRRRRGPVHGQPAEVDELHRRPLLAAARRPGRHRHVPRQHHAAASTAATTATTSWTCATAARPTTARTR